MGTAECVTYGEHIISSSVCSYLDQLTADQSDTHGWLSGHIKERNYGADWGDYVSFIAGMKKKAKEMRVDLLVVDSGAYYRDRREQSNHTKITSGDLHDGTGLSDSTKPNGEVSNEIFVRQTQYDLLTIGMSLFIPLPMRG